jgi:erythromycin esterase-like protein
MRLNWRSKKLTQSAKHESCVACGADDGTIVWAHSNHTKHDKGMGIKAHDLFGAYLCHRCHDMYDNVSFGGSNEVRYQWFKEQWEASMLRACRKGYL